MKSLVLDSSSIISLVTNDLLWLFKHLKKIYGGEFYIPHSVKLELVDDPLKTKKFKLEAIMVSKVIEEGDLKVHDKLSVEDLLDQVNRIYSVGGKPICILHKAEIEALVLTLRLQADAYVVDERTMRLLIEDPKLLKKILARKLHRDVGMDMRLVKDFQHLVKGVKVIRSTELALIAYEKGLLDRLLTSSNTREDLVDGLLWGLRLRGCSISNEEIADINRLEAK